MEKIVYNEDLEYIVSLLKWCYLWPKTNRAEDIYFEQFIQTFCFGFVLSLPLWGMFFHTLKNINHLTDSSMTINLVMIVIAAALFIMVAFYFFMMKRIVITTNSYIKLQRTINYKKLLRILYAVITGMSVFVVTFKVLEKPLCEKRKTYKGSLESCGYMFPVYFPFNFDAFPFREIIITWQCLCIMISFIIAANLVMLMVYFIEKIMVYLRALRRSLKNSNSFVTEDKIVANVLGECVELHNRVLNGISTFNDTCRYINLTHFAMSSVILAILVIDIIKTRNIQSILQFVGWAPALFVFTWHCQNVINEAVQLQSTLYEIKWYKMSLKNQKTILIMLAVAQRPLGIEAGPLKIFCLESFLGVLQGTYSYVTTFIDF